MDYAARVRTHSLVQVPDLRPAPVVPALKATVAAYAEGLWPLVWQTGVRPLLAARATLPRGFIGMAVPGFLLALVLMYLAITKFGMVVTGLFSPEYADAPWSFARVADMMKRIWLPVIIIGINGTAGLIRVMRGTLLDELRKPYVTTARAKGIAERKLLFKYPVRIATNPMISTIGWLLPSLVSGAGITAIVLNLPTTGPVLLRALMAQDMYLAGSFVMILSILTVIGTLISDILLAVTDPRIRYGAIAQ